MRIDASSRTTHCLFRPWLYFALAAFSSCLPRTFAAAETPVLSLSRAVEIAVQADPWLTASRAKQKGLEAQSRAVQGLPNPKLSFSAMNLPTDSFRFNQESMTQLNVGVSQMFPRGDTRALRSQEMMEKSHALPFSQLDRQADVTATVSQLWLDAYKAERTIALITDNRALFEQLVEIARANYAAALGRTRQQDIIRAQLELTSLDNRLSDLEERRAVAQQKLAGWMAGTESVASDMLGVGIFGKTGFRLTPELPDFANNLLIQLRGIPSQPTHDIDRILAGHPAIRALDQNITAATTGRELSAQQYKPEWGLTAAYSYRDNAPTGLYRADFFSIGLTIDIPILQRHQTDASVQAAAASIESLQAERRLTLRNLRTSMLAEVALLEGLSTRLALYQEELLPQFDEYAEATLTAYTNDESAFVEVVRARIDLLNAKISALALAVDQRKAMARLDYLWPRLLIQAETQAAFRGEQP